MEDDSRLKTEDTIQWKTTLDEQQPLVEDDLRWKRTLNQTKPSRTHT